jgi:hypothetical protein
MSRGCARRVEQAESVLSMAVCLTHFFGRM